MCTVASQVADNFCGQELRATLDKEVLSGPGFNGRIYVENSTGHSYITTSRWPILSISSVETSPNSFPRSWTTVSSNYYDIYNPSTIGIAASGVGSNKIVLAAGYGPTWWWGENGYLCRLSYINGFPHTSMTGTAAIAQGATTIPVDDISGCSGNSMTIMDGPNTEVVAVSSSTPTATVTPTPGNLTLTSGTAFAHTPSATNQIVVTAMPMPVVQACVFICTYLALTRGATAIAIPPAHEVIQHGGDSELLVEAFAMLQPYKAVLF